MLGWGLGAVAIVAAIAATDWLLDAGRPGPRPLEPAQLVAGYGPATFPEALAKAEANVSAKRYLLTSDPGSWLRMEGVGRALLARARLTASAADLAEANAILAKGVESAPWPAGPVLSRAGAALMVHDLVGVEAALERLDAGAVAPTPLEQAEARGMRCEVAFERGQLATARELCSGDGGLGLELRRANMALASGHAPEAARIVEGALRRPGQSPLQLSARMLQRTAIALAQGDWDIASTWAREADRRLPGHWLAEAFVAQSRALEGDTVGAEAAYRAIAERTGNPDVYGALAVLAEARGDEPAKRAYMSAAGRGWDERIRLLPHTYGGHYGEYLALTGDIAGGIKAAGDDFRRRPYLQPLTDYVFVLDKAGQSARIVEVVERGEKSGFTSATLLLAKSHALAKLGRPSDAAKARADALRLNPRIEHPRQAFVHFRQD